MILYGSTTSPYVRRLRLLLQDVDYEFQKVQVFQVEYREDFAKINPVMKVPALVDGDMTLFDSNVIAEYLHDKLDKPFLSITQKNVLATINGVLDSLVQVMILSREGISAEQAPTYVGLQEERAQLCFAYLEYLLEAGEFSEWDFLSISLYTTLDWIAFRQMSDWSAYPKLEAFYTRHQKRDDVIQTDPRL